MKKQIIAFIDPQKFAGLLGHNLPVGYYEKNRYLNGSTQLVYIDNYGNCIINSCDNDYKRSEAAIIILVPDTFRFDYTPNIPFKVLYHSGTNVAQRVIPMRKKDRFHGELQSYEDPQTIYHDIAKFINKNDGVTFDYIYNQIPDHDITKHNKEALVKAFLQNHIYNLEMPDVLPDELMEYQADYDKFRDDVNALSKEEKSLQNYKLCCLLKQLKIDLGL